MRQPSPHHCVHLARVALARYVLQLKADSGFNRYVLAYQVIAEIPGSGVADVQTRQAAHVDHTTPARKAGAR